MKALLFTAPGTACLIDQEVPRATRSDALVAPAFVGLCGTDLELYNGSMPYFSTGDAAYPVQPGHEVVGVVLECPVDESLVGANVLIDPVVGCGACGACAQGRATLCSDRRELGVRRGLPGGAASRIAVPAANLHPLPVGLTPRDAVLAEPGVTVLNALDRLGDVNAKKALVVGAGTLGLIAVQLLQARSADVDVFVDGPHRSGLIREMGASMVTELVRDTYDVAVEAAGTPEAVHVAIESVIPGGGVALTGVHGKPMSSFDVNQVVLRDITVYGVLNGPGLYPQLLDELASGAIKASFLIDSEFDLAEFDQAIDRLRTPERAKPKVLLSIGRR